MVFFSMTCILEWYPSMYYAKNAVLSSRSIKLVAILKGLVSPIFLDSGAYFQLVVCACVCVWGGGGGGCRGVWVHPPENFEI